MSTPPRSSHLTSSRLNEHAEAMETGSEQLADLVNSPAVLAEQLGLIASFESGVHDLGQQHAQYLKDKLSSSDLKS